jgi:hypothetical protein
VCARGCWEPTYVDPLPALLKEDNNGLTSVLFLTVLSIIHCPLHVPLRLPSFRANFTPPCWKAQAMPKVPVASTSLLVPRAIPCSHTLGFCY